MKRLHLISLIIGLFAFASYPQYGIVVNKLLYDANSNVRTSIANYMNALKDNDGQTTVWLYEYNFSSSNFVENPSVLRQVLINHYNSDSPKLQGVVFVGDLPYVLTIDSYTGLSGPTDWYWMDMDGTWTAWTGPGSAIYGSNSNANTIEIWISRVPTNNLTMLKDANGNTMTEAAIATQYFSKVVARMTTPSMTPYDMACFAADDADLNNYMDGLTWKNYFLNPDGLGFPQNSTTLYEWNGWADYNAQGIIASWTRELQKGHTVVIEYWHGTAAQCHLMNYEFANMYAKPSKVPFFLLNSCATGRNVPSTPNCIAGLYAIGQGGLIAIGQTITINLVYQYYTLLLSQGMSFGEAYKQGGLGTIMMTLFGAGTLKMQPFVQPTPDVSAGLSSNGDMYCFIRGNDMNLYSRLKSGNTWSNYWKSMGGTIQRNTAVGKDPDGSLYVFAVSSSMGTNNYLKYRKQASAGSTTWNDWINLSSSIAINSPIATAQYDDKTQAVFARSSSNNALYMLKQNSPGGAWASSWTLMNATAIEDKIAVGKNSDGRLEVFVRNNSTKSVMNIWQNTANGSWSSNYGSLGGPIDGSIAVESNSNGKLELFVGTQMNFDMWHCNQLASGGWSSWSQLIYNNCASPCFAVGKNGDKRLEVFTSGKSGVFTHIYQLSPSGAWFPTPPAAPAITLGANLKGFYTTPAVINYTDGRLAVLEFAGSNIWCIEQTLTGGWGPWTKIANY